MQKLTLFSLLLSIFFSNCVMPSQNTNEKLIDDASAVTDTFHLLTQYWQLTDAGHPTSKDVSFTSDDGVLYQPGIIFMTDSSVLENPTGEMTYGTFNLKGNTLNVKFDDGRKATYLIDRVNKEELLLSRTEKKQISKLTYKATSTNWPDANKNPFAKQNYKWAQKPKKPESDEEIRNRVKQNVQFYVYYFTGFLNGKAQQIDFTGLPDCLKWYSGGIAIDNEDKLDKKWISCFYSKEQSYKARQMLEDVLVKKHKWDEKETNWIKQTIPVLQQIHDGM
jgi:hypothetical protein